MQDVLITLSRLFLSAIFTSSDEGTRWLTGRKSANDAIHTGVDLKYRVLILLCQQKYLCHVTTIYYFAPILLQELILALIESEIKF